MKDDLIRRQAAIDAILAVTGNSSVRELYEHVQEHGLSDMWSGGVNAAIDIIIAVPSAQPDNDRIWEALSTVYNMDNVPDEAKAIIGDVMLGLDEPSAQPEQRWIPCSERPPEENSDILVTYVEKDEKRIVPVNYGCGIWFDCIFDRALNPVGVLAWTLFPEPYREDGKSDG